MANPYPAVSIEALSSWTPPADDNYFASRDEGTSWFESALQIEATRCPLTKIIMTGYSQGADAAGDALQESYGVDAAIFAAVLWGDPKFDPSSGADELSAGTLAQGVEYARGEYPQSLLGPVQKVFSYCHVHDPVCAWWGWPVPVPDPLLDFDDHLHYDTNQAAVVDSANWIVTEIQEGA
jgi:Cutinase